MNELLGAGETLVDLDDRKECRRLDGSEGLASFYDYTPFYWCCLKPFAGTAWQSDLQESGKSTHRRLNCSCYKSTALSTFAPVRGLTLTRLRLELFNSDTSTNGPPNRARKRL